MKRHVMLAAVAVGFVATTSVPAAAQFWGAGWHDPYWNRGVGVGIGVGTPYAYAGPGACTCPPSAAYGTWGTRASTFAPAYAYEPAYTYSPGWFGAGYAYDPGYVGYSYGPTYAYGSRSYDTVGVEPRMRRDLSVGVRSSSREFRTRDRIRSDVVTRGDNIRSGFATRDRGVMRTGVQGGFESRSTTGSATTVQSGGAVEGNAMRGQGRANIGGQARGTRNMR
jgi:hypothetical protein